MMKTEDFNEYVDRYVKRLGYEEYRINSMEITEKRVVNENGELENVKAIDVTVVPKKSVEYISIEVKINNEDGFKEI